MIAYQAVNILCHLTNYFESMRTGDLVTEIWAFCCGDQRDGVH